MKRLLATFSVAVGLGLIASSARAEVMPGADALGGLDSQSAWTEQAQPSEPVEEAVTPVAAEPKQVKEDSIEVPTTEWDASEWTVVEEQVAPAAVEEPDAPIVVHFDDTAVVEPTPTVDEEVEETVVVESIEEAPTVSQSLEPEAPAVQQRTPLSPEVPSVGSDRDVEVSVYGSYELDTGETNIGQTTSIPVGETGTVKVTTGFGGVSTETEATNWNNQALELSGQIGDWDNGEAYGIVTLSRNAYQGGNDDGYSWSGEETRLDLTAVAVHRVDDDLTFTGEAGVDVLSGQGRIQGDATWHIQDDLHITGSLGTDGRSAQLAWYPSLSENTNLILGVQTIRAAGDDVSRQSAFGGVDFGDVEVTIDTEAVVRVNTALIRF